LAQGRSTHSEAHIIRNVVSQPCGLADDPPQPLAGNGTTLAIQQSRSEPDSFVEQGEAGTIDD